MTDTIFLKENVENKAQVRVNALPWDTWAHYPPLFPLHNTSHFPFPHLKEDWKRNGMNSKYLTSLPTYFVPILLGVGRQDHISRRTNAIIMASTRDVLIPIAAGEFQSTISPFPVYLLLFLTLSLSPLLCFWTMRNKPNRQTIDTSIYF